MKTGTMLKMIRYTISEVSEITGVESEKIQAWIQLEWIEPHSSEDLDWEDVTRIQLIQELARDFGANDEAIPLILHLIDQVCYWQEEWKKREAVA